MLGATYSDVQNLQRDSTGRQQASLQLLTPRWSGNFVVSCHLPAAGTRVDITGNWYGPQRLPVLPNDFRPTFSPWYCLLNLQAAKEVGIHFEVYGGVKNLLNFMPQHPIMRPHDPFDKNAGNREENPHGYTFDPSYNYAPLQGIRAYFGLRVNLT